MFLMFYVRRDLVRFDAKPTSSCWWLLVNWIELIQWMNQIDRRRRRKINVVHVNRFKWARNKLYLCIFRLLITYVIMVCARLQLFFFTSFYWFKNTYKQIGSKHTLSLSLAQNAKWSHSFQLDFYWY